MLDNPLPCREKESKVAEITEKLSNEQYEQHIQAQNNARNEYVRTARGMPAPKPRLSHSPFPTDASAAGDAHNAAQELPTLAQLRKALHSLAHNAEMLYDSTNGVVLLMAGLPAQLNVSEPRPEAEMGGIVGELTAKVHNIWAVIAAAHRNVSMLRQVIGDVDDNKDKNHVR